MSVAAAPADAAPATPWYYRTPTVLLLLVFIAPLGLFLLWRGVPSWSKGAKVGATILTSIWFLFGVVRSATDERAASHSAQANSSRPDVGQADAQSGAPTPRPDTAPPRATHADGQTASKTTRGDAAATGEPWLLVPIAPAGFTLTEIRHMDVDEPNVRAKYKGARGLTAEVWPAQDDDKLEKANPARSVYAANVRQHPALLEVQTLIQTVAVTWRSGRWYFTVSVRASSASNLGAARAAASEIAEETSTWADRVLTGDDDLIEHERTAHLDAINAALTKEADANSQAVERSRGKELDRYRAALKRSGVEMVAGVALNRIDHDLLEITLRPAWAYQPRSAREQAATDLWTVWAGIHSPDEPDHSFIRLLDSAGNKVGGSSGYAGSSVSVSE